MLPYGFNGHYHYEDCKEVLNTHPGCSCIQSMAKQISMLAEEVAKLMRVNRQLQRQLDNGR
jgi:hypothetical protein